MIKTISQKTWKKLSALSIVFVLLSSTIIFLTSEISQAEGSFALLENYPGLGDKEIKIIQGPDSSAALKTYVDWIVKFSLGLLSIGAVIALVYSGIEYIGSETWLKKSDAKDRIFRSVGALVLMFSAFIFFDQLNPELLKVRFKPLMIEKNITAKDREYETFIDSSYEDSIKKLHKDGYRSSKCVSSGINTGSQVLGAAAVSALACSFIPIVGSVTCGAFAAGTTWWNSNASEEIKKALKDCQGKRKVAKLNYKGKIPKDTKYSECMLHPGLFGNSVCYYEKSEAIKTNEDLKKEEVELKTKGWTHKKFTNLRACKNAVTNLLNPPKEGDGDNLIFMDPEKRKIRIVFKHQEPIPKNTKDKDLYGKITACKTWSVKDTELSISKDYGYYWKEKSGVGKVTKTENKV